jgi:HMG (high mobility group) box
VTIPSDKPRRPLSAYNLFFQLERENIINGEEDQNYTYENVARIAFIHYQQSKMEMPKRKHRKTHGKISFAALARTVATKWKKLSKSTKALFEERSAIEQARYQTEIDEWAKRRLQAQSLSNKPLAGYPIDSSNDINSQSGNAFTMIASADDMTHEVMPLSVFRPMSDIRRPSRTEQFDTVHHETSSRIKQVNTRMRSPHQYFHDGPEAYCYPEYMPDVEFVPGNAPAMTTMYPGDPLPQSMESATVQQVMPVTRPVDAQYSQHRVALEVQRFQPCPLIRNSQPVMESIDRAKRPNPSFWPVDDTASRVLPPFYAGRVDVDEICEDDMSALLDNLEDGG